MSDMAGKLFRHQGTPGSVAVASLKQLLQHYGDVRLVFVDSMGQRSTWERQSGGGVETLFRRVGV